MSVRVLLVVLIVLLAANLGMEIWYRMDPPQASPSEDALAPAPFLYDPQYYDDNAGVLPPSYYYDPGLPLPFHEEFQGALPADADFTLVPDLYDHAATPTVARIVDGDTFELSDGTMLRLIGIDTPEVHPSPKLSRDAERSDMDRETIRELGRRASAYAAELALGKPVELEYGSGRRTDRYGRTLAYVWVLDEYGRRLYRVNDRLVADGYANIYSGIPFEYSDEYLEYEREAREEGRGLWGEVEGL
ncbi:MAG: thermonuclease family protein [Bacteroidetes bacterium SB0662_bin_6]|nr:thermonuclease family protein [Bacteroidetes bacterium SB0668_bin_1]MYE05494.1 thermonuclease family protein [Bacteroidetes bacterium SB0662_bin_6]